MNDDKIYDQIKDAAEKSERHDFPGMDKVWHRVEEKLDTKVLTSQNSLYKKIAVAATILLAVTLGFYFIDVKQPVSIQTPNIVVATDSIIRGKNQTKKEVVEAEILNPGIKADAPKILHEQLAEPSSVVTNEEVIEVEAPVLSEISVQKSEDAKISERAGDDQRIFEARGVQRAAKTANLANESVVKEKSQPLIILNGEHVAEGKLYDKSLQKALASPDDSDEILILNEPLYIINGVHYSELELFGPKPTSPYAPLNSQKIETLTILQGDQAIAIYGDKGRKGVVIITTEGGKPAAD